jgi:hypothetical protein
MTLYQEIKKEMKGFGKTNTWYRDWLFGRVSGHYTQKPKPGQMLFFSYFATTTKVPYFDKYPLVMVNEIGQDYFAGGNLHYMEPILRTSIGKSFQNGGLSYPPKMHHKYLKINATSPFFVIDELEWADIGLIPVEEFVKFVDGRTVKIPSSKVWNDS